MADCLDWPTDISDVMWRELNGQWVDGGNMEGNEWPMGGWDVMGDR
jgi:hypothetical protein